jgi:hypothetical protein
MIGITLTTEVHGTVDVQQGLGVNEGFNTVAEAAEWLMDQFNMNAPIIAREEGSNLGTPIDAGDGGVRYLGEVSRAFRSSNAIGGADIIRDVGQRLGTPLFAPTGDVGIFHFEPLRNNRMVGMVAGREPIRFLREYGVTHQLKAKLVRPTEEIIARLDACEGDYPMFVGKRPICALSYCEAIRSLACFQFSFLLRWDYGSHADVIRSMITAPVPALFRFSDSRPRRIMETNKTGMLMEEMFTVVAAQRGETELDDEIMSSPVTENEIGAVSKHFKLIICLYDVTAQAELVGWFHKRGMIASGEILQHEWDAQIDESDAYRRGASRVWGFDNNYKGRHAVKSDRLNNMFVFVGFCKFDKFAHLEPVLCARKEKMMVVNALKGAIRVVEPAPAGTLETTVGLVLTDLNPPESVFTRKWVDKKFVQNVLFWDKYKETTLKTVEEITLYVESFPDDCIAAIGAYDAYIAALSALEENLMDQDDRKKAQVELFRELKSAIPYSIGSSVLVDEDALRDYATMHGKEHRNSSGLLYMYSRMRHTLKTKDMLDTVHLNDFSSVLDQAVARKLFTDNYSKIMDGIEDLDDLPRFIKFKELSSFSANLMHPTTIVSPDRIKLEFGRFAHVSVVNMERKGVAEEIVLDLLPDTIRDIVVEKVAIDEAKRAKIKKQCDVDDLLVDIAKGRKCKLEVALAYGSLNKELVAKRYALNGVHNIIMGRKKGFNLKYGMKLGTYSNPKEAVLRITDPQIDEPAGAPRRNGHMVVPSGPYFEIDFNGWYPAVIAGLVDGLLLGDFAGGRWYTDSMKRPTHQPISYEGNDYLWHYKADHGFVIMGDVDWLTMSRRFPKRYHSMSTYYRYTTGTNDGVKTRKVYVSKIIQTCLYMLLDENKIRLENNQMCMSKEERREFFIMVQRDMFRIRSGVFNMSLAERHAVHSVPTPDAHIIDVTVKEYSDTMRFKEIHLKGVLPQNEKFVTEFKTVYKEGYKTLTKMYNDVPGMSEKDSYKAVKRDLNSAIGSMKAPISGGVKFTTTSALKDLKEGYVLNIGLHGDNPTVATATQQLHVCTLPRELDEDDNIVLVQSVDAAPICEQGVFRCHRIDTLAKASCIMEELAIKVGAFANNVDAVYCENVDEGLKWLNSYTTKGRRSNVVYPNTAKVTAEATRCMEEFCSDFYGCSHCTQQKPWETIDGMDGMPLVKIGYIPAEDCHKTIEECDDMERVSLFNKAIEKKRKKFSTAFERDMITESDKILSTDGAAVIEQLYDQIEPVEMIYTSSFLPDIYEDGCTGVTKREIVDEMETDIPEGFARGIGEHFLLYNDNPVCTDTHVYEFGTMEDKKAYYDEYTDKLVSLGYNSTDGLMFDGAPGSGKSTVMKRLLDRYLLDDDTFVHVTTATHSSLDQIRSYDKHENICVSTFHSFVGVFDKMAEAARDAKAWFSNNAVVDSNGGIKMSSGRYMQHCKNGKKKVLIVDEVEMLSRDAEELLLELSKRMKVILIGDKKQTAPTSGLGLRCEGAVVNQITGGKVVVFDVPFRCADPVVYKIQQRACTEDPTLYLDPRMTSYSRLGGAQDMALVEMCRVAASEWITAGNNGVPYNTIGIATLNHKAAGLITMMVLGQLDLLDMGSTFPAGIYYTGNNSHGKKGEMPDEFDDSGDEVVDGRESVAEYVGRSIYVKKYYHHPFGTSAVATFPIKVFENEKKTLGNPGSTGFYVGTSLRLIPHRTYKAMNHFLPSVFALIPDRKQMIKKGTLLRYQTSKDVSCRVMKKISDLTEEEEDERERRRLEFKRDGYEPESDPDLNGWYVFPDKHRVTMYSFIDCTTGKTISLSRQVVSANVFYPFAGYTGNIVGHTYDQFYVVSFCNTVNKGDVHYVSIKDELRIANKYMGKHSWVSPFVKSMNVATTRVTTGNVATVYDVPCKGKSFWYDFYKTGPNHIASKSMKEQISMLYKLRNSVVLSERVYSTKRGNGYKKMAPIAKRKRT